MKFTKYRHLPPDGEIIFFDRVGDDLTIMKRFGTNYRIYRIGKNSAQTIEEDFEVNKKGGTSCEVGVCQILTNLKSLKQHLN